MSVVDAVVRSIGIAGAEVVLLILVDRYAPRRRNGELNYTPLQDRMKQVREDLEKRLWRQRR